MAKNTILHLSLIENLGAATIQHILTHKDFDLDSLYLMSIGDISTILSLHPKKAELISTGLKNRTVLDLELELIEKHGVTLLTCLDPQYSFMLREIYAAPAVLYVKGHMPDCTNALGIVGARKANDYGRRVVSNIVPELVKAGFVIVSGGAQGIDTFAHTDALNCGGITVAVLGSGLLMPYPQANNKLFDQIAESGGAVVSAFPLKAAPLPINFPARNRIISGISKGVLVVQAAQKSGALITAQYALEQNRDVFAVPGNIDDDLSAGCNNLIKQGAKLVTLSQDVLQEYGFGYAEKVVENWDYGTKNTRSIQTADPVLDHCYKPKTIDELLMLTGIELADLQIKLFDLQIEGKIEQNFAGLWQKL